MISASLATSTWTSYNRAVIKFIKFRHDWELGSTWPVSTSVVAAFLAYLSTQGLAASTIFANLSAIAFVHKINGWLDPTDSFIIRKMREGTKRLNPSSDFRRPITFSILKLLIGALPSLCKSSYEVSLFRAAFSLAFFGFLRVGEFTCASKNSDPSRIIALGDVSFQGCNQSQLVVIIRYSKTDQVGRSTSITIDSFRDPTMCPVSSMHSFLDARPLVQGPAFLHFGRDPLTRFQFSHMLKKGLEMVGLPSRDFSPHSFRIGAATSAAMCGASDDLIQAMGRWKSTAFQSYIRPSRLISFM